MVKSRSRKSGTEQYYTPTRIIPNLLQTLDLYQYQKIIEPSAGTGNFLQFLPQNKTLAYDIEPKHPQIIEQDFLKVDELFPPSTLVIGNFPFGRACSLAVKFFNHSANLGATTIASILPKSFRKWSIINRLDANFHLSVDQDLSIDYVDDKGIPISSKGKLNTVWQIWHRQEFLRDKIVVPDHNLIWKSPIETADVAICLFGRNFGQVFDLSKQPQYRVPNTTRGFFQVSDAEIIDHLYDLDYAKFALNVSFTPALSIQEIRFLLNKSLDI